MDAGRPSRRMNWRIRWVDETGSTNADLAEEARAGAPEGSVRVAGHQTAGRGRLARGWTSPPGVGLTFSVLLCPDPVGFSRWGWLPAIAGLAVTDALRSAADVTAELKWPNDVLVADRKLCGILGEVVYRRPAGAEAGTTGTGSPRPAGVVIGIGLNVSSTAEQLPPRSTSVSIAADRTIRPDELLSPVLDGLADWYGRWRAAGGDADAAGVRTAFRERSATLGRVVSVQLPGEQVTGEAVDVDAEGRLVLRTPGGERRTFGSGDVVHAVLR